MPAQILSWYSLKYFAVMILMLMLMLGQKSRLAKSYIFNETNSIKKKLLVKVLYDYLEVTLHWLSSYNIYWKNVFEIHKIEWLALYTLDWIKVQSNKSVLLLWQPSKFLLLLSFFAFFECVSITVSCQYLEWLMV
jgi:hypothetical protein